MHFGSSLGGGGRGSEEATGKFFSPARLPCMVDIPTLARISAALNDIGGFLRWVGK